MWPNTFKRYIASRMFCFTKITRRSGYNDYFIFSKNRNDKYCSTITTVYLYVCATFRAKNGPQNRPYIGVKIENMSETWFSALEIISFYQKIEFPRNTRSSCTLDQRSPGPKKVRQSIIILEDSEHPNFTKLFE